MIVIFVSKSIWVFLQSWGHTQNWSLGPCSKFIYFDIMIILLGCFIIVLEEITKENRFKIDEKMTISWPF